MRFLLAIAAIGMLADPARANIASRSRPGQLAGELGGVHGLAITSEDLVIDLRPLATSEAARVRVAYAIDNPGPPRRVELLFAAGLALEDTEVLVAGKPAPLAKVAAKDIPPGWRAPAGTPALHGTGSIQLRVDDADGVSFAAGLAHGATRIEVRYLARAGRYLGDEPTAFWQFVYLLAPARDWDRFADLTVTVHLPEDWMAASAPALERRGHVLAGRFPALPADALTLTARAPVPRFARVFAPALRVFCFAVPLAALVGCAALGRRIGNLRRSTGRILLAGAGVFVGFWLLLVGLVVLFTELETLGLPTGQAAIYGEGYLILMVAVAGIVLALGVAVATAAIACAARRRSW